MILNLIDKQKHVFFLFIKKTHNTQQGLWTWSLVMGTQWGRRSSPIHRFKFFLQRIILHPPHHHHDHPHHHSFHNKLLWSFYNLYQLTLIIAMSHDNHDNHDNDKSRRCPGAEMQKAADAANISVLFFQLVLIFGLFWVIFGPFFVAKYASVLSKSRFATLGPSVFIIISMATKSSILNIGFCWNELLQRKRLLILSLKQARRNLTPV